MGMIPTKKLILENSTNGIMEIALVDDPAIMVNWFTFSNQKTVAFSVQDEEQRIAFGPVLIPNLPIYRKDDNGFEFNVYMDADTIRDIAIKYMREGRQNLANEMHDPARQLEGVTFFEWFIADPNRAGLPKGYESLPMGTLFTTAKINNEQAWAKVKDGTFKGFSMQGFFGEAPAASLDEQQVQAIVESVLLQN